jgi:Tfp pilus assembly protein PilF
MVTYYNNNNNNGNIGITVANAGQHENMMHALVSALRISVNATNVRKEDRQNMEAITDLLDALIPDELQLEKGIQASGNDN